MTQGIDKTSIYIIASNRFLKFAAKLSAMEECTLLARMYARKTSMYNFPMPKIQFSRI